MVNCNHSSIFARDKAGANDVALSRTETRRRIRELRKRRLSRAFWLIAAVTAAGTLGSWLWEWTGTPAFLE